MKRFLLLMTVATMIGSAGCSAEQGNIKLNEPTAERGHSVMKALKLRHSEREYADKELSMQDLSDLMWAAYGINRQDGRRTAASALNKQDVDLYVFLKDGVYLYAAAENELQLKAKGDHRALVAGRQENFATAPAALVMVSDISRFGMDDRAMCERMGAMDAALVSQNVSVFCAGAGLATVPRASMDSEGIKKLLGLTDTQIPMINNPVGYPVGE